MLAHASYRRAGRNQLGERGHRGMCGFCSIPLVLVLLLGGGDVVVLGHRHHRPHRSSGALRSTPASGLRGGHDHGWQQVVLSQNGPKATKKETARGEIMPYGPYLRGLRLELILAPQLAFAHGHVFKAGFASSMSLCSPSFPPGSRVPRVAAVHRQLEDNLEEVSYRPLRRNERPELEALHQEWFPVAYGKSFYDEVFEKKSLHSMAAVVHLARSFLILNR